MLRRSVLFTSGIGKICLAIALLAFVCTLALTGTQVRLAHAAAQQTYLVLFNQASVSAGAITAAGGTLVYSYDAIGVAIATSNNPTFASDVAQDNRVEGASPTAPFGTRLNDDTADTSTSSETAAPSTPPSSGDSLSGLQWDMNQIHAPEAHNITGGRRSACVGDIDTGLDFTHPDLAPNVAFADSVSCIGGVPNQNPNAWMDDNGHGTHTAGTHCGGTQGNR